ncbi:TPR repeat protein [Sphingobium sp. B1D7B]|uniref:hypothetical protein n=1 Tax=unclassified Sphingobium TaxID=2611147 RepID=UPI0022242AB3|nr:MULTISPECIES: hypothetical protein [unclassified Sphingobium]MCW2370242.1 TPR repeat protein [Sphingobium sp. B11D3D]MCW2393336.1 TPR repeat protein [Sphingobium sp. B11D3A]MCW2405220.1 TPR repeat protein [Sphingobium sp. B1D7B]
MRSALAALVMMIGAMFLSSAATAQPAQASSGGEPSSAACVKDSNVDSCWQAGVAAERRGDARAALAAYEASCDAGFQVGGCYEAGKIYFLNSTLRDYGAAKEKMARVCDSSDIGIGPYACKYLGIIYRRGLAGQPQLDRAFNILSRACFLHNDSPFIDGNGCEILADDIPDADALGVSDDVWAPDYIAYLAFAMGCTDDMPALCTRALTIHDRAVATSAGWLARCAEDAGAVQFSGRCGDLARAATVDNFDQRQALRRRLVRMFVRATEYAG